MKTKRSNKSFTNNPLFIVISMVIFNHIFSGALSCMTLDITFADHFIIPAGYSTIEGDGFQKQFADESNRPAFGIR
jgi:hypothetical protein